MATQEQIDKFLEAIIGFESGGNATAKNPYASASGLFGYIDSTWANFGGYRHARDAPPEVQWAKARQDVAAKLRAYGNDFRLVAMAWYLPAAVSNPALRNTVPAPQAGNTKTPNQYADMVMSRFTGSKVTTASGGARATVAASEGSRMTTAAPEQQGVGAGASQQQILDYIAEHYPHVYGLLSVDKEVKSVLLTAARDGYDRARLEGALAKTKWWQTHTATQREWEAASRQDKATANERLARTRQEILTQAARLGIPLDAKSAADMALRVQRDGWTQQMVLEGLSRKFALHNARPGAGLATVDALRVIAADYGVKVGDRALGKWTQDIIAGRADDAGFKAYIVQQAKTLFPTIAGDISEGTTVRQYFDPYVQEASDILGISPEDVDLSDTKWRRALVQVDPTTNKRVPMNLDQWRAELRTNAMYGYDRTQRGRAETARFGADLARALGGVA